MSKDLENARFTSVERPFIQSGLSFKQLTTVKFLPPCSIKCSFTSISNSSSVSNPSARNAGDTITTSESVLANSSTTEIVDGLSHLAGPSLL